MPNVRTLNEKKYGLGKHEFLHAYHFAMCYNRWRRELAASGHAVRSPRPSGDSCGGEHDSQTERLGIRRAELSKKAELVEQCCLEAAPEIYKWLLLAVTNEGVGYDQLAAMGMPCGRAYYYRRRRHFYWSLAQKI